jgi:hypothetical protein
VHHAVSFVASVRLPILGLWALAAGAAAQQQIERYNLRDLLGDERGAAVEQSFQRGTLKELLQGMPGGVSPATNVQRGMLMLRVAGEQQKWMGDALQLLARDKELELRVQLTVLTLPLKSLRDFALKPGMPKIVDVPEAGALIKACQKEQGKFWNLRDIAAPPLCAGELPAAALPSHMPRVRATVTGLAIAADEAVLLPRIVGDGRTIADAGAGVRLRVGQGALIAAARGPRATVLWVQLAAIVPVVKDPRPVTGRE